MLLRTLSDPSDEVVLLVIEVLAQIASTSNHSPAPSSLSPPTTASTTSSSTTTAIAVLSSSSSSSSSSTAVQGLFGVYMTSPSTDIKLYHQETPFVIVGELRSSYKVKVDEKQNFLH